MNFRKPACLSVFTALIAMLWSVAVLAATPTAAINLTTNPTGADVYATGPDNIEKKLGKSPLVKVKTAQGSTKFRIVLDGYNELLETVTIGKTNTPFAYALVRKIAPATLDFSGDSDSSGATITVDGTASGAVPTSVKVPPGKHQVVISKAGYLNWERWLDVTEAQKSAYDIVLKKQAAATGSALISSSPSGSEIKIDGMIKGKTPNLVEGLSLGSHVIEVNAAGYKAFSQSVMIKEAERATVDANLELVPKMDGSIDLSSGSAETDGADVLLDGKSVGKIPFVIKTQPGKHQIIVSKNGFISWEKQTEIGENQKSNYEVALKPQSAPTGGILATSIPSGADIKIDGALKGKTAMILESLSLGTHAVEIMLDGYKTFSQIVDVKAGARATIEVKLEPIVKIEVPAAITNVTKQAETAVNAANTVANFKLPDGSLGGIARVVASLPGAKASFDNDAPIATPCMKTLSIGTHFVTVAAPGASSFKQTFVIKPNETVEIVADMKGTGKLKVTAPVVSSVDIDGTPAGSTPLDIDVSEGVHKVTITGNGVTEEKTVTIAHDVPATLTAELKSKAVEEELRAMSNSAFSYKNGDGTVDFGLFWPSGLQARLASNIVSDLNVGLVARFQLIAINEVELFALWNPLKTKSWAVAVEAGLGGGLGAGGRNSFVVHATGLASVRLGKTMAATLSIPFSFYSDNLGDSTNFPTITGRSSGMSIRPALAVDAQLTDKMNLVFKFDGSLPFAGQRPQYGSWKIPGYNADFGGGIGISFLF